MKSSPVVLLSLGLLTSAATPGEVFDARAIASENLSLSSTLESRSDASNVEVERKAKVKRLRRHRQALERLRQRRTADDTGTDTDHDTDDDDDHRHVTTTSRSTLQTTLKAHTPGPTTWNRDCDTTDTEWEGERRTSCISRLPSTTIHLSAASTTPAAAPPTQTSHHGTDTDTDTDRGHGHGHVHDPSITPRPTTTVHPTRSGCPPRCRRVTRTSSNGSWTDGDTTDCMSDDEWRRNCEAATRTTTTLADVTRALGAGSSVTVSATPGSGSDVPALADHELTAAGPRARPEAVGGAVVLAGLVAAAMVL